MITKSRYLIYYKNLKKLYYLNLYMSNNIKISKKYSCYNCNYSTDKKSDWNKHLLTQKHKNNQCASCYVTSELTTSNEELNKENKYICLCGNYFTNRHNLSRHKKTCTLIIQSNNNENLIMKITELEKQINNNNNNNNNNNITNNIINNNTTINQNFNINLFLNNDCKDALNLEDFVNQIQIQLEDLDFTKNHGFIKGMKNIFVRELNLLDQTKRPIHCSDVKREILYIKNNNEWVKDKQETEPVLNSAINKVSKKQSDKIQEWITENEDKYKNKDEFVDDSMLLMNRATQSGEEEKVIKSLVKEVLIEK